MFENLVSQPVDKIIEMINLFKMDPRTDKIDLGVGVYKDHTGNTPIMRAVKTAEARLHTKQSTKTYLALAGQEPFIRAMRTLSLGNSAPEARIAGVQTPGGTGAIRQLYELIARANPNAQIWVSRPSWPNHIAILKHLGIAFREYSYFDPATGDIIFDAMMHDLANIGPDDVVILHGCCHNPTGTNLTLAQWEVLAHHFNKCGATPLVDLAYQGFGDGLEADVQGLRLFASLVPEMLLAQSCSKNFGLYRDRVGAAFVISRNESQTMIAQENLNSLNRLNYSFPPDHGAALVAELFADPILVLDWKAELEEMRLLMLTKRQKLAEALRRVTNSDQFDFIEKHRGMFSLLGIPTEAILKIREENAIYIVHDSRINIAGMPLDRVDDLARAIAQYSYSA